MATFNDLCKFFVQQKQAIELKGGTVTVANANPSPNEILTGINSIKVKTVGEQISAMDGFVIYAAERPNTTLKLYNSSDQLLDTKVTDTTNGGYVIFYVSTADTYTIKAYDSEGAELWTNSKELDVVGVYNIKSGLALNDYTWAEINTASKNGYAKYMWNIWDYKDLDSFMGSTTTDYRRAYIIGFNHDDKVEGGKAGITFMIKGTSSKYSHSSSSANWMSWRGSLIRKNCLKSGEDFYTYTSVSSSTEGTYYVKSETNPDEFIEKTLPDEYLSTYYYYTKQTLTSDGAFIAGMPSEMLDYIVQVKKKTFGGMDKGVTFATDQTTIVTNDWMFIPSDAEIFGNTNRYVTYSKYALEGEQYEAFKGYYENRFRFGNDRWLRSPYSSTTSWCCWNGYGSVTTSSAYYTSYLPLCFCI